MKQDFHDLRLSIAPNACVYYWTGQKPTPIVIVYIEESQTSLLSKIKNWLAINL